MTPMRPPSPSDPTGPAHDGLRLAQFSDGSVAEWQGDAALAALSAALARPAGPHGSGTVWVDLADAEPTLVERVASLLGLHPLTAEDVVHGNQRSKIEVTDGLVHLVVFALDYAEDAAGPATARTRDRSHEPAGEDEDDADAPAIAL